MCLERSPEERSQSGQMQPDPDVTLYAAGPVTVPQRVLAAGAMPMIHHRTAAFHALYGDCAKGMQWLLNTRQDILLTHTSGRGAMEACISNLLSPGDEIICVANGKFGNMFAEIATAYGLTAHRIWSDWTRPFEGDEAATALSTAIAAHPKVKAVTICHSDTSNSVENDIRLAAEVAHRHGVLVIVDAVSSAGCARIEFDAWQIDALATASQKGLMSPAGAAFVVLSDRAWQAAEASRLPKFFVNLLDIRKEFHKKPDAPETPGSTPVSLIRSVSEALTMIREEGRDAVFARHARLSRAVRQGLTGMGLELVPGNLKRPSLSVTTFFVPQRTTGPAIRKALLDSFRIQIAGGLGEYKDTTLRIGHMGYFHDTDALCVIAALETTLHRLGVVPDMSPGIAACMRAL